MKLPVVLIVFFPPLLSSLFKPYVQNNAGATLVPVKMPTSFPWIISHCGSLPRPLERLTRRERARGVGSARRACLIRCPLLQQRRREDGGDDGGGDEDDDDDEEEFRLSREHQISRSFRPTRCHAAPLSCARGTLFAPLLFHSSTTFCFMLSIPSPPPNTHPPTHTPAHTRQLVWKGAIRRGGLQMRRLGFSAVRSCDSTLPAVRVFGERKRPLVMKCFCAWAGERWHLTSAGTRRR